MKKVQVLILIALVALVIYYFSPEKSNQKPGKQVVLPKKPTSFKSFSLPKMPVDNGSFNQELTVKAQSPVLKPPEISERSLPTAINSNLSLPEVEPDGFVLAADNLDDYYRQQLLALMED